MARTGAFFGKFKERQLSGASSISLGALNIKAVLISLTAWGLAVTAATNASPSVVTTATHGLTTGMRVAIVGAVGNTAINGTWGVTVLSSTTFSLYDLDTGSAVNGNGTWTSGGRVIRLDVDEFLSDVSSGDRSGGTSGNLASKTFTLGTLDAADFSISSVVAATYQGILYYNDTGTASTSNLINVNFGGTGFPLTVGSGSPTVNVTIDATGIGTI